MKRILAYIFIVVSLAVTAMALHSCGIYSFTGTSIQPDVKTVTINYFEYQALKVNPSLSNMITEAMQDKFLKLTKLEQVDMDGDLEIIGAVTGYDVKATAVTANESVPHKSEPKFQYKDRTPQQTFRLPPALPHGPSRHISKIHCLRNDVHAHSLR